MNYFLTLALLMTIGMSEAEARLVQILHTNDLHSMFVGARSGRGGYARLKTIIDELKKEAARQNIPTLVLDGGDFGEGSSFYFSNQGTDAMKAMNLLGIDVSVLGNHDFMMGTQDLLDQMNKSKLKTTLLSANFQLKKSTPLEKKLLDYVDYDIDGFKLRIFGLTTHEIHYQYPIIPQNFISSAHNTGIQMARKSQTDKVDYLIALTHIGVDKDKTLASRSRSIDLIVGGHSHTRLERPDMVRNLNGQEIPVVQTGAHGLAIGSMIVDIQKNGASKMIDYRLYDVTQDIPENQTVKNFVQTAYEKRDQYFNRSWNEVIGFSDIPLTGLYEGVVRNAKSCWSEHMARLTRTAAQADIGFQFAELQGEEIPAGEIRFGDMIDNFPHFRKWGDQGWTVARAKVQGFLLKQAIGLLSKSPDITLDGLMAYMGEGKRPEAYKFDGTHGPSQAMLRGNLIKDFEYYSVAMPSEVPHAVEKTIGSLKALFLKDLMYLENTHYWSLLEDYIKTNSPLGCLND